MMRAFLSAVGLLSLATVSSGQSPRELSGVNDVVDSYVSRQQISGAVTAVVHRGRMVHLQAAGFADLKTQREMRANTVFAIASMTKPITATAVLILQDEGKLAVDDPVSKHLPAFENLQIDGAAPVREVTIRDLMTHTSGLGRLQQDPETLADAARMIAALPMSSQPGQRWQYGHGLTVCGRLIEVVSGKSYEEFLRSRIFAPLRMVDTTFWPNAVQQRRVATLYQPGASEGSLQRAEHPRWNFTTKTMPNPSGGLFSTAQDMAKFYQMILNGGAFRGQRIVSREAVRQMTQIQTGDLETGFTPGNGWGLGWCVVREPQGVTGMLAAGTFGHGGAFGTQGWVDPQEQTIYVLMIQRTGFGNSDGSELRRDFQQAAAQALKKSPAPRQPGNASRRAPTHADVSYGPHERNVLDLYLVDSKTPTPLVIYIHGGGFRAGDKRGISPGLINECQRRGFSVASLNYRLTDAAPYPAPMNDAARAVQFLRYHARRWNLDPRRVGATGGSAGAGISLWLAFRDDMADAENEDPVLRQSTRLTATAVTGAQVSYDPRWIKQHIGGRAHEHPALGPFYGIAPEDADKPAAHALYEAASPITYLTADDPPTWMFYSEPDVELPADARPGQGIHHPRFGHFLKREMDKLHIECTVVHASERKTPNRPALRTSIDNEIATFFARHFADELQRN